MLAGDGKHPREKLLQQISSQSDLLVHQLGDFKNLIRDRKVVSFYETEQTRRLVLVRGAFPPNLLTRAKCDNRTREADDGNALGTLSRRSTRIRRFSSFRIIWRTRCRCTRITR
jgi:hypothetical protein